MSVRGYCVPDHKQPALEPLKHTIKRLKSAHDDIVHTDLPEEMRKLAQQVEEKLNAPAMAEPDVPNVEGTSVSEAAAADPPVE